MSTLLLRLEGPLQSWGMASRFSERESGLEPSKSGVIGLLCAALGRRRVEPVDDLAALRMGVRVDREGSLQIDFQTGQGVARASGQGHQSTVVSRKHYMADACFLVGFEGDEAVLRQVHSALLNPVWPLCLGRKSYVPSRTVYLPSGLREEALEVALAMYPPLTESVPRGYRFVLEADGGALRHDQPLAPFAERRFGQRFVTSSYSVLGEVPHGSI